MRPIAYVSTYLPKRCGLATYTHHLRESVQQVKNGKPATDLIVAMTDGRDTAHAADSAIWPLARDDRAAYAAMAERINNSAVSLVSLQHEFGIFGGEAGEYVLDFVRRLEKPLVTTFHTVFEQPAEPYRSIQQAIIEESDHVIVMNRKAVAYLHQAFGVPEEKITYIPHGTPVPIPEKRLVFRKQLGWDERKVIMTFGLLNRGKGIELMLNVLPEVIKAVPNVLYAIVGQTHPEVKKREGEAYREELLALIREKGLDGHVVMVDRYLDEADLVRHITACDLYVTPYPGMQQITSGTLAYAVGLGRPVLSTPYSYARDLLEKYGELLIPYGDEANWSRKVIELLSDPVTLRRWERRMERIGKRMHWPHVGLAHAKLFARLMPLVPVETTGEQEQLTEVMAGEPITC